MTLRDEFKCLYKMYDLLILDEIFTYTKQKKHLNKASCCYCCCLFLFSCFFFFLKMSSIFLCLDNLPDINFGHDWAIICPINVQMIICIISLWKLFNCAFSFRYYNGLYCIDHYWVYKNWVYKYWVYKNFEAFKLFAEFRQWIVLSKTD